MLKYVKEGALDLLAFTFPSSLIESIRQVSDDDFLSPEWGHQQRQPRMRRRHNTTSSSSSRAVAPTQRHLLTTKKSSGGVFSSAGSILLQDTDTRSHDLPDSVSNNCLNKGPQLPYEVLTLIFQYLPASDMFSILAVNRLWRQIALMETKQIDLSECFPMDCLGLGDDDVYSDFDFVYHLFSIFPLISSLVIKDRYMRDRDLRVVTAGILAGKMAFTEAVGPVIGSEAYQEAQHAIAQRRAQQQGNTCTTNTTATPTKPVSTKVIRASIKEELREFSRSVATYVLIPQTRNTLRKKILERLEYNLEQKEIQEYCWMVENGIDPLTFQSSTAASLTQWRTTSSSSSSHASTSTATPVLDAKRYPLVPMTHYRFQDCCFAKDWGAAMDINKLPMIGLAAAISGQGLVVDLEGSYGAPSKSIKQMMAFCFGAHCVISLDLNFRHTHMELEHITELLSENPMLHKIDIVDSPAYHDLIRLPALRGLGEMMERMQKLCFDLDEQELKATLQQASVLLAALDRDINLEDAERADKKTPPISQTGQTISVPPAEEVPSEPVPAYLMAQRRPMDDPRRPVESLSQQLIFADDASPTDKIRTAKVLLKGVIYHGVSGLINTRDRESGQALLHTLAWRRSYSALAALATQPANPIVSTTTDLTTPPETFEQQSSSLFSSSPSSSSLFANKGYFWNQGPGLFSSSAPSSSTLSEIAHNPLPNNTESSQGAVLSDSTTAPFSLNLSTPVPAQAPSTPPSSSGLSSLINISALPAALSSALSFRRMSLPVSTLWIPEDSEDIGVGGGTQPEPDSDDEEDKVDSGVEMSRLSRSSSPDKGSDQENDSDNEAVASSSTSSTPIATAVTAEPPAKREWVIPEQHPVAISLRMARKLLELKANPNVYNKDGRSAVVCASYMGFLPMESLLIEQGGYSKELIRIRETM
ncbi:hypothetical protein K457DRAFT_153965 [Linnemannia elongata AG-77]|uniref:F-box domain-containing protein n=1 Tax=Linnemannia elongata AG-77 TaxID=1314771 RepID=A0A197K5P7_9FUNG|nr:hypothetical protein K457DRAFT_153965 [Linnemannia elongata AG-77]